MSDLKAAFAVAGRGPLLRHMDLDLTKSSLDTDKKIDKHIGELERGAAKAFGDK